MLSKIQLTGLALLLAATLVAPAYGQPPPSSTRPPAAGKARPQNKRAVVAQQRVEDLALVDQAGAESERDIHALIKQELGGGNGAAGRLASKALTELSPRAAALSALRKNLSIQRGHVAEQIAHSALLEAEAVFDPVLLLSVAYERSETFTRIETDQRFRRATRVDAQGRNILGSEDPVEPDPRAPRAVFDAPGRREGSTLTPIVASQAPITGPTESFTYDATLAQQLPWGADLTLTYQAIDQETFFINNPAAFRNNLNSNPFTTSGSYERPWISSFLASLRLPLPGSKEFGPYAEQEVRIKLADLRRERAFWDVESVINNTLLEVDLAYWDLINSLLNLRVTVENRKNVETLLGRTNKLFDLGEATNYDRAQAQGELARVQGQEEAAWNGYVLASNALVRLLDLEQDQILLPAGYTTRLATPYPVSPQELSARSGAGNPDLSAAIVDVKAARVEQERRGVRTRPDVSFVADASFSQFNGVFGYTSLGESMENTFDPDVITQSYSLEYLYPWGNRAVKARFAQAEATTTRTGLAQRLTHNRIHRDINNGLIGVASASERIAITERNVKLAELAYEKAVQQQQTRVVTEYEVVEQNRRLLTARLDRIQAQTERKQAEARFLAASGLLARVYAERSSQTALDRHRLNLLAANQVLQHFGGNR